LEKDKKGCSVQIKRIEEIHKKTIEYTDDCHGEREFVSSHFFDFHIRFSITPECL
jgi:hypothetical protein